MKTSAIKKVVLLSFLVLGILFSETSDAFHEAPANSISGYVYTSDGGYLGWYRGEVFSWWWGPFSYSGEVTFYPVSGAPYNVYVRFVSWITDFFGCVPTCSYRTTGRIEAGPYILSTAGYANESGTYTGTYTGSGVGSGLYITYGGRVYMKAY